MSFEPWAIRRVQGGASVVTAFEAITTSDRRNVAEVFDQDLCVHAVACVNALAGLDPSAVLRVVEAAEKAESVLSEIHTTDAQAVEQLKSEGWDVLVEPELLKKTSSLLAQLRDALAALRKKPEEAMRIPCDCTDPDCPTRGALSMGMGNLKLVTILWNDDALMVNVDASMRVSDLAARASRWFGTIPGDRPVLSDHGNMLRDSDTVDAAMKSTVVYELVLIGGNV